VPRPVNSYAQRALRYAVAFYYGITSRGKRNAGSRASADKITAYLNISALHGYPVKAAILYFVIFHYMTALKLSGTVRAKNNRFVIVTKTIAPENMICQRIIAAAVRYHEPDYCRFCGELTGAVRITAYSGTDKTAILNEIESRARSTKVKRAGSLSNTAAIYKINFVKPVSKAIANYRNRSVRRVPKSQPRNYKVGRIVKIPAAALYYYITRARRGNMNRLPYGA
jgi:hypothetical protein